MSLDQIMRDFYNSNPENLKNMTVGEKMKALIMAEDYGLVRQHISDEFIEMARAMLGDYQYIEEKENKYQENLKSIKK